MALAISERTAGEVTVMKLEGRLVLEEGDATFKACIDRLTSEGRMYVVVDLDAVTYIDSAGLGAIVGRYVSLRRRGGDLKLVRPTPRSTHVLDITKLSQVFEIFDCEEDAVRSFPVSRDPTST
jgi:anti-sigma B factor antagonist